MASQACGRKASDYNAIESRAGKAPSAGRTHNSVRNPAPTDCILGPGLSLGIGVTSATIKPDRDGAYVQETDGSGGEGHLQETLGGLPIETIVLASRRAASLGRQMHDNGAVRDRGRIGGWFLQGSRDPTQVVDPDQRRG